MLPYCPNKFTFNFCANGHRLCAPCLRQYILHYYSSTSSVHFVLRCPKCKDLGPQECVWAISRALDTAAPLNRAKLDPVLCGCQPPCKASPEQIKKYFDDVCEPNKVGLCEEAGHFLMEMMAVRKRFCEQNKGPEE